MNRWAITLLMCFLFAGRLTYAQAQPSACIQACAEAQPTIAQFEPTVQEKVKAKLDKEWAEIRKGKQMIDFTFEDLFNGKGANPET
jgi:long-subunit acyl-CoA synthetase (AMP-forming)